MSRLRRLLVLLPAAVLVATTTPSTDLTDGFTAILNSNHEVPTLSTTEKAQIDHSNEPRIQSLQLHEGLRIKPVL